MERPSPITLARRALLAAGGGALAGLALPLPALAQSLPRRTDLRYDITAYGLTVGDLQLAFTPSGDEVSGVIAVRAAGLAALFGGSFNSFATHARPRDGRWLPATFTSVQEKSDRQRHIDIAYGPSGAITSFRYLNNGRETKSDVPAAEQRGTVDPVTAFLRLRAWVVARRTQPGLVAPTLPVFDGRKRYDINASSAGHGSTGVAGQEMPAEIVKLVFVARFGFEPGDALMTFPGEEPVQYANVYFAADEEAMPLRLETVGHGSNAALTRRLDCAVSPDRSCG